MTFEHRHENKSCSACRDRVNERVKVAKVVKVKVFQVFQNIPGSQLLSDIQTFFSENPRFEEGSQFLVRKFANPAMLGGR